MTYIPAPLDVVSLGAKTVFAVLELLIDEADLFDTSRFGGTYPALRSVIEALPSDLRFRSIGELHPTTLYELLVHIAKHDGKGILL